MKPLTIKKQNNPIQNHQNNTADGNDIILTSVVTTKFILDYRDKGGKEKEE